MVWDGAALRPGFRGFRRFKRFRGWWWRLTPQIIKKGRGSAAGCVEGLWKKVLKMDRPLAGGFLSLTGPLAPRVVVSPYRAMSMKSALRIYLSASYVMKSTTVISHLRWLSPLWWLAPPPFPRKRGHYKAPLCCELLMKELLFRALLSHRSAGGRWCCKAPKGECIFSSRARLACFPRPQGGCMVFRRAKARL